VGGDLYLLTICVRQDGGVEQFVVSSPLNVQGTREEE